MNEEFVRDLAALNAAGILILAAMDGKVTKLECAMPVCICPGGRTYFEPKGHDYRWAPSADRWPVPGREGGEYTVDNVRVAHTSCNYSDGGRYGGAHSGAKGERNGKSRVTQERALEIRELLAGPVILTYAEVADQFGIGATAVHRIAEGTHWSVRGLPAIRRLEPGKPFLTSSFRRNAGDPEIETRRKAGRDRYWAKPESREARAVQIAEQWKDPEVRARHERGNERSNPARSTKLAEFWASEAGQAARRDASERMKRQWTDPDLRSKRLSGIHPEGSD